ncbi:hypothetical protein STCU_10851 [Strigomonas culicis]|uniref:Uncharacterized protein n=1 Tax=Strigomonas culicis TaxID=28005 RepID=S9TJN6_9TRYP|nr:hypothetical protein STCU_10851 [Strigomonas culicis]|eukprot:EPY17039.1 hypothetical protein STCU_10851 [Strigomonas culicis]
MGSPSSHPGNASVVHEDSFGLITTVHTVDSPSEKGSITKDSAVDEETTGEEEVQHEEGKISIEAKPERPTESGLTAEDEALLLQLEEADALEEHASSATVDDDVREEGTQNEGEDEGEGEGKTTSMPPSRSTVLIQEIDSVAPAAVHAGAAPLPSSEYKDKDEDVPPCVLESSDRRSSLSSSLSAHNTGVDEVIHDDGSECPPAKTTTVTASETTLPLSTLAAAQHRSTSTITSGMDPYTVVEDERPKPSAILFSSSSERKETSLTGRVSSVRAQLQVVPLQPPPPTHATSTASYPLPCVDIASFTTSDSDVEEFQTEFDPFA